MWKWIAAGIVVFVVVLGVLMTRERSLTLPAVEGPFGILPDIPGETRSMAELTEAARNADPEVRRGALMFIGPLLRHGKLDGAEVEPLLLASVKDHDGGVREVAAGCLALPNFDPEISGPVLASLVEDPDWKVRANAVSGLTALLERHAAVEGTARKMALPSDRRMSAATLDRAVKALVPAWNDSSSDVRHWVSNALIYRPEVRYAAPKEWLELSQGEARERAIAMGFLPEGETLLDAVEKNDVAGVFILLRAGVDPNSRSEMPAGHSPLFIIIPSTRPEITRLLLDAGADVKQKDKGGRVAWDWVRAAQWEGDPVWAPFRLESLEMLRAAGAAPEGQSEPKR